ncbi:uncharacterized protein LOC120033578 isoform X2 [Salvelinus namaycush]|uniref:Cystein proteinase inhibitor protein salarin n=1 Tax=Salvelinus namaycush TaxID=8040 RepID=A0A8U0U0J1_SALNM|nr:uncharacterized protein LOC120033578 isoform X2 [Salvelinus namaycush]
MKSLVLLLLVAVTVSSVVSKPLPEDSEAEVHKEFETWKVKYVSRVYQEWSPTQRTSRQLHKGKSYPSTEEEAKRKGMWLATRKRVMEHNTRAGNGLESYTMAVNHFADLTTEEVPKGLLPMPRPEEEEVDKEFEMWKTVNGKTYNSTEEEARRKEIWLATRARVMEHNKRAENGSESFTMGMNHLSDRTTAEVTGQRLQDREEAEVHKEFETWKVKYGKTYPSTEEEAKRKEIWLATRKMVTEHNKRAENGQESFTMAVNHFADLTTEEVPKGLLPMPRPEEEEVDKEFEMWKTVNGKTYNSTEEEARRKEIWLATRARVMEHNKRAENGSESFTMGMNHLSDRTTAEVTGQRLQDREEAEVHKEFETWKVKYGKTYPSTEEEAKRKEIWLATRKMVTEHNKRAENGQESFTMAVNHFADLTTEEVPKGLLPMPRPEEEEVDKEFEMWKTVNGKTYNSTEEEARRKEIWLATRARVMEHNKRAENGSESFTMGMNHLSDRTTAEVTGQRLQDGEEAEVHKEFETWKVKYGKTYPSTEEEAKRKEIWLATRKMVTEHNKRAENGQESFTMAVNHFADLTTEEVPRGLFSME